MIDVLARPVDVSGATAQGQEREGRRGGEGRRRGGQEGGEGKKRLRYATHPVHLPVRNDPVDKRD